MKWRDASYRPGPSRGPSTANRLVSAGCREARRNILPTFQGDAGLTPRGRLNIRRRRGNHAPCFPCLLPLKAHVKGLLFQHRGCRYLEFGSCKAGLWRFCGAWWIRYPSLPPIQRAVAVGNTALNCDDFSGLEAIRPFYFLAALLMALGLFHLQAQFFCFS